MKKLLTVVVLCFGLASVAEAGLLCRVASLPVKVTKKTVVLPVKVAKKTAKVAKKAIAAPVKVVKKVL